MTLMPKQLKRLLTSSSAAGGALVGDLSNATVTTTATDGTGGEIAFDSTIGLHTVVTASDSVSFSVTRSLGLVSSCVTWILILGLGRSPDDDFDTTSRTVEFTTGATTNGFDVLVLADTDPEVLHRYQLMLFDPASGASLGSSSFVEITIEANDDLYGIVSLIHANVGTATDTDGTFRVLNIVAT